MNKKIIITGTSGYIGGHLATSLESDGNNVQRLNVRDSHWKYHSFEDVDVIIHTAALVHNNNPNAKLEDYFKVNMHLPIELATKAKKEGVNQFIFMSTMAVYGEDGALGSEEEITNPYNTNPITNYGRSKAGAEKKLLEMASDYFKVVIVRSPMVYGKDAPGNFTKLKRMAEILPIIPKINNSRSAIYINHLEKYIHQFIINDSNGVYHPKDNFNFNTTKVILEIRKLQNKKTILIPIPEFTFPMLNKVKIISKIYGNLVYGEELYLYEEKMKITQKGFYSIIKSIITQR
ncbi:NAD-dependent epimerase/dehydratase family protein [Staphylococcus caprae]|uniref:NAD-dependent epimerase/dehydratase family protein n=1 Tax=Staphylococcus caprae TaxID=29380 RepID=UPI003B21654D